MMRVGKTGGYHVIPFRFGQEQINQMVPMYMTYFFSPIKKLNSTESVGANRYTCP